MSQLGVLIAMIGTSLATWSAWRRRWRTHGQIWVRDADPKTSMNPELVAIVAGYALLCVVMALRPQPQAAVDRDLDSILRMTVALNSILAALVLIGLRISSPRRLMECDLNLTDWRTQLRDGVETALASFVPTLLVILATHVFRTPDNQHILLQKLTTDPSVKTVTLVIVSAVIIVPLAEELVFRVVLLGWLKTVVSRRAAVTISSLIFATMHGWPDAIALVPLSLLLGSLYEHRRRLMPIYVAHATFNAVQILLTLSSR